MKVDNEIRCMWAKALMDQGEDRGSEIVKWLKLPVDAGVPQALKLMGDIHMIGMGVEKNQSKAFEYYKESADADFSEGQSCLGDCYKYGWGVDGDIHLAVKCYSSAVEQGDKDAMYELSELLLNSEDVDKDEVRGCELLKNAAENGHAKAQFMYGSLLINPSAMNVSSVEQNVSAGIEMLRKSSDQSFGMAECTLATFYAQGIGVEKDLANAKDLYERALEHGGLMKEMEDDARKMLAELESAIDSADETSEEYPGIDENASEEDKAEFKELYLKAQNGDSDAQYSLGVRLSLGRYGASKNRSLASDWYKKSADGGNIKAMVSLADYYKDGEVNGKDVDDAVGLYKKAALAGDWRAQHVLAEIYSSGESVPLDYAEALKWALLAADNDGTADVLYLVGKCYEEGLGTEKNMTKAFQYYQKAAKKDSPEAQPALVRIGDALGDNLYGDVKFGPGTPEKDRAECRKVYAEALEGRPGAEYEMGNVLAEGMYCIFVNKKEAFAWYLKSAEHGFADAQYAVAGFYSLGEKDVVDCNDEEKFKWYWEAAAQGHVESMRKVADSFYYGSGVDEDRERAKIWYARASKAGDDVSFKMLRDHWKLSDDELHRFYGIISEIPVGMNCKAGDEDKSKFRELLDSAKSGDAVAQFRLGHAFVYGEDGAKMNEHHGVMWLKKSAAQGNADAAYELGDCYRNGWGVEEDVSEAFKWYKKAAELGEERACFKVGYAYYFGKGLEEDEEEAFKWFAMAAEKGHAEAQCRLAECYLMGNGVEKDLEKAREWYRKSAEQGEDLAQFNLGKIYYFGKGIEKDFAEAYKWFAKAAEQDRADAQVFLGTCYRRGLGTDKDLNNAFEWYSKSAKGGNAEAQFWVGKFYAEGWGGVAKDYTKAVEWYEKSAAQDDADAICALGWCYQLGNGVEQDYSKAVEWFKKGVDQDDGTCMNNLARLIEEGKGAEQDYEEALELFKKAIENDCDRANYHLGRFYENGLGCEANAETAKEWYQKAADKGDKDAKAALERLG